MFKAFATLVPAWVWIVVTLAALGWVGIKVEQHGADRIQTKWDKAEADRKEKERLATQQDASLGNQGSQTHEDDRNRLQAELNKTQGKLDAALKRPARCGPTAGDVVVPGDLGVRLNAITVAAPAGPTTGKPAD